MRCSVAAAAAELERQQGRERRKTIGRGRMRKDLVVLIYKGGLISGREKRGGRKLDYPAAPTPRFSGWLLR